MSEVWIVFLKVFPVIFILVLGAVVRKLNFISSEAIRGMKRLTLNIFIPCLIFLTFFRAELKPDYMILSLVVFIACCIEFALGFVFKKLLHSSNQFYPSVFTCYLTGPIGFPLFIAFFGIENLYKLAILDIGNSFFMFTVLMVFLSSVSCNVNLTPKVGLLQHLKNLFSSPLTLSMFLGIIMSLTVLNRMQGSSPEVLAIVDTMDMMVNCGLPLALLIIGYELPFNFYKFKELLTAVLLRLTMMISIAYILNTFVLDNLPGIDKSFQLALYTLFILPPPFIIPLSIIGECEHKNYILNFISLHLILSLIAFVFIVSVL